MTEELEQLEMFSPDGEYQLAGAEMKRFYFEVGQEVVALGRMLREPTATRPFVYELRFDLWPVGNTRGLTIAKGFGEEAGLISFNEGAGLVGQLRGLYGRFQSGKQVFSEDKFQPGNYDKRVELFLKEQRYLAAKLPTR